MNIVYLYPAAIKNWFKKIVNEGDTSIPFDRATWKEAAKQNKSKLKFFKTEAAARRAFEETKVIFRVFPDGAVIALFPQLAGTNQPHTCSSYMHVGQHGSADISAVIQGTRLATLMQYANLYHELTSAPYEYVLKVVKRETSGDYQERKEQVHR